jgi:epoxyqueuosine reductase
MKDAIRAKALELGFAEARFTSAAPVPGVAEGLAGYLAEGCHADMGWMAKTPERRVAPQALWADAKSVIVLGENYGPGSDPLTVLGYPDRGHVSVYARGRDYHHVLKKRLKTMARWLVDSYGGDARVFTDTAPVMEKPLAARAGLGWQGRHTNLVSRHFGSWLFLGEIFTTLEFLPDRPEPDRCGLCHRCETICPTGALANGHIDPRRCVSYLTIEHKGHIPLDLRPLLGNRIYGCDDCLAVCPWNKFALPTREPGYLPRAEMLAPRLADLACLDDAGFRDLFAGSPVKRIGRERFLRNVLIAAGNSHEPALISVVRNLLCDPTSLVRVAAIWALRQLMPEAAYRSLAARHTINAIDADERAEWDRD